MKVTKRSGGTNMKWRLSLSGALVVGLAFCLSVAMVGASSLPASHTVDNLMHSANGGNSGSYPDAPLDTATATATASTTQDCGLAWREYDAEGATLNAVDFSSNANGWSVGSAAFGVPEALEWNGNTWTAAPIPYSGTQATLNAVLALAPNDAWAVGDVTPSSGANSESFTSHWNGTSWIQVPSPSVVSSTVLYGVDGLSSNDVWAVGGYLGNSADEGTIVLHWTGSSWNAAPLSYSGVLYGIDVLAPDDIWAVGTQPNSNGANGALTFHYNGVSWSQVPVPSSQNLSALLSVSGTSANDVWAVGYWGDPQSTDIDPRTIHWDGSAWTLVSNPAPVFDYSPLTSVAAISPNDVWAVGYSAAQEFAIHWDGMQWNLAQSPNPGGAFNADANHLFGVSAIEPSEVVAVGSYRPVHASSQQADIEQYDDPCVTPTATPSSSATATATRQATLTATATSTPPAPCTIQFADVPSGSTFYSFVHCLSCRNYVTGYPCGGAGEPCNGNSDPYFRPGAQVTRGQLSKIVANAAGFSDSVPATTQTYADVAPGSPFWVYVERLSSRNVISGYACGRPSEPCDDQQRPYFQPNDPVTRGQTSKIVANASGESAVIPPTQQTYADVSPDSPFWVYIERLSVKNVMGGYTCGGVGEPCDTSNRPYFRPGANVTRGQSSKIVANTFYPNCATTAVR